MRQPPEEIAEALRDVVITYGLSYVRASSDTHVITVQEPGLWNDSPELDTQIVEREL